MSVQLTHAQLVCVTAWQQSTAVAVLGLEDYVGRGFIDSSLENVSWHLELFDFEYYTSRDVFVTARILEMSDEHARSGGWVSVESAPSGTRIAEFAGSFWLPSQGDLARSANIPLPPWDRSHLQE